MVGKLYSLEKDSDSQERWSAVKKKNGPRIAPVIPEKHAHGTMNHTSAKI